MSIEVLYLLYICIVYVSIIDRLFSFGKLYQVVPRPISGHSGHYKHLRSIFDFSIILHIFIFTQYYNAPRP